METSCSINREISKTRIVIFGLGGVGKSSLVRRYLFDKFNATYTATVEDNYCKIITHNKQVVDLSVLDTAGSYQFPAMRRHAIKHGHGFVIVYAIDNEASIEEAKRRYNEIKQTKNTDTFPVILVGNKIDRSPLGKRKISRDSVRDILYSWGYNAEHIETSAKLNHNVALVFNKLIGIIQEKRSFKPPKHFNKARRKTVQFPVSSMDVQRSNSFTQNMIRLSMPIPSVKLIFGSELETQQPADEGSLTPTSNIQRTLKLPSSIRRLSLSIPNLRRVLSSANNNQKPISPLTNQKTSRTLSPSNHRRSSLLTPNIERSLLSSQLYPSTPNIRRSFPVTNDIQPGEMISESQRTCSVSVENFSDEQNEKKRWKKKLSIKKIWSRRTIR